MDVNKLCLGCMAETMTEGIETCPKCGYKFNSQNPGRGLQPQTILNGKYLVGRVIGEGGFGITYIGYDLVLGSRVAIKEYFPVELASRDTSTGPQTSLTAITGGGEGQFKRGMDRFLNEASNLARFNSLPGIVSVRDFFYENNTAYMVMEYIDGMTLTKYLEQNGGRLPYGAVLNMMRPVMDSLRKVHEAGVIHMDISPDNIIVSKTGEVKLIDFGAARFVGGGDQKSLTVILKHGYAPEEQYQTNGRQGPWTDVYALAATMYRMMTGVVPQEATERVLSGDKVLPPNKLVPDVPRNVSNAIMHGMAVKASERSKSIDILNVELASAGNRKRGILISVVAAAIAFCVLVVILSRVIADRRKRRPLFAETSVETNVISDTDTELISESFEESVTENIAEETDEAFNVKYKEADLLNFIERAAAHEIDKYVYEDFTGDGIKDMFAAYDHIEERTLNSESRKEYADVSVWYADQESVRKVGTSEITYGYLLGLYFEDGGDSDKAVLKYGYPDRESFFLELSVLNGIPILEPYSESTEDEEKITDGYEGDVVTTKYYDDPAKPLIQCTEEELINSLHERGAVDLSNIIFEDFNGDGIKELFATTQIIDEELNEEDGLLIWFADSRGVKKVEDNTVWFPRRYSEVETVQYGKTIKILVNYSTGGINSCTCEYEYDDYEAGGIKTFNAIVNHNGKTCLVEDVPNKYSLRDAIRYYDTWSEYYEVGYIDGIFYEFVDCPISEELLKYYLNYGEIIDRIMQDFSNKVLFSSSGDYNKRKYNSTWNYTVGDMKDWSYVLQDKIYYSSDGNVYIVYECWDNKASKDYFDGLIEQLDDPWEYFLDSDSDMMPASHCYFFHARLKTNGTKLEYDGLYAGDRLEKGSGRPFYPNMMQFFE